MATEAARPTSTVVASPAARPRSLRLTPNTTPVTTVSANRNAMSCHSTVIGMSPSLVVRAGRRLPRHYFTCRNPRVDAEQARPYLLFVPSLGWRDPVNLPRLLLRLLLG